ncbi:MAG: glycosyltransferase family 2 protein [Rhodococcus sp. (in: high G+C Gram-positive bacteria)]|nr:MAG: glycosyltransferase family 2 protein [Rhodococcus sp. (in: high G+C Gram-positive bacteria)]
MSESCPLPVFSFLTTAYRTEQYLAQTIESVRRQTRTDWELIVVDNGCSDEIASIVGSFASDSRIRLVRQENRGYEGGVTAAADLARGQYVCVLDSDDLLMPDFCARTGAVLAADRAVDAVGCDALLFDDHGGAPKGYLRSIGFRARPHPAQPLALTEMLAGYIPYYTGAVRLRYHQAMRRARRSLLEGNLAVARGEAKAAFAQRHTLRAALVTCSLSLFPDTLRRLHPVKHRVTVALGHTIGRRSKSVSRP